MSLLTELRVPAFKNGGMPGEPDEALGLEVLGLTARPAAYNLAEVRAWPQGEVDARLTSVSGFSVRVMWQGVLWRDFLAVAQPLPRATHATFTAHGGGYSTTVPLTDLARPRVLLCLAVGGQPLERLYGGPLRMVIPNLWGYKSCKWLASVEFTDHMRGGFWEDRGYTRHGRIEPGVTLDLNTGQRRPINGGEVTEF